MDIQKTLSDFKKKIDVEIAGYLDDAIEKSEKEDFLITDSLKHVKKLILAGGKRLRPALMYYGYIGAGGKERKKMLKTSISVELIHMFLLIHDDIIDKDSKRHGIETINAKYKRIGDKYFPNQDSRHFGDSMAIIVGDTIGALGNQVIFNSGFRPDRVLKALWHLQSIVSKTVMGEAKDVYLQYKGKAKEEDVLEVYEFKTAKYTIEGPLQLGAILGGAGDEVMKNISRFAVPLGIAFQIQDDILGIFGDEKKLGKEVGSDIREGKQTILVTKAIEKASREQNFFLGRVLGKKNLEISEIEKFRKIIENTGSLDYARKLSSDLVMQSKKALDDLKIAAEARDFLAGIAEYMVNREI
jgi:geranylgeranyl diphosphate synthase type I